MSDTPHEKPTPSDAVGRAAQSATPTPSNTPAHVDQGSESVSRNPIVAAGRFQSDQTSANVIAYLISGPASFAGMGWLLDHWLGTGFFVLLGMLGGMALSLYVIWLRYGTQ